MNDDLFRYFAPEQRPDRWRPGVPIDLLPALRRVYPGCLNEEVTLVRLVVDEPPLAGCVWSLHFVVEGSEYHDGHVNLERQNLNPEGLFDTPPDEYPADCILWLLDRDNFESLQEGLPLFRPEAFNLLLEIRYRFAERELATMDAQYQAWVSFLQELNRLLAQRVAEDVDLFSPLRQEMLQQPASSLFGEVPNYWLECGAEASQGTGLHEMLLETLRSRVRSGIHKLRPVERLALCLDHNRAEAMPDAQDILSQAPPASASAMVDTFGTGGYAAEVVQELLSAAADDYMDWQEQS